ncbi:rhodanese-like domain-containing protein [Winogradskyella maritima]|uniref:Rhodanese-like domain-containing protein n=1 Tax=Winogradskyella maritima TaxID=1517766 RepID=A0ABV8AJJ3_9FLAO|nr:rhodanese-like domain-containing protein [Winogradskyella maritima]
MGLLDFLFGNKSNAIQTYLEKDAEIIDVRTAQEWNAGHLSKAKHIPLSELSSNIENLKALNKPIIVHCQSGIRSEKGARLLKSHGIDAINGGSIAKMNALLKE